MLVSFRLDGFRFIMGLLYDKGDIVIDNLIEEGSVGHVEFLKEGDYIRFNLTSNMMNLIERPLLLIRRIALLLDLNNRFVSIESLLPGKPTMIAMGQTNEDSLVLAMRHLTLVGFKGRGFHSSGSGYVNYTLVSRDKYLDPYLIGMVRLILDHYSLQNALSLRLPAMKRMDLSRGDILNLIFENGDKVRKAHSKVTLKVATEGFHTLSDHVVLYHPYWEGQANEFYYHELYLNYHGDLLNNLLNDSSDNDDTVGIPMDRYSLHDYGTHRGFCRVNPIPFDRKRTAYKLSVKNLYLNDTFKGLTLENNLPDRFFYLYQNPDHYPDQVLRVTLGTILPPNEGTGILSGLKSELCRFSLKYYGTVNYETYLDTRYYRTTRFLMVRFDLERELSYRAISFKNGRYEDRNTYSLPDGKYLGLIDHYTDPVDGKIKFTLRERIREE